jgi:hypothetical protein
MRRQVIVSKTDFATPDWQEKTVSLGRFLERPEVRVRGSDAAEPITSEAAAKVALRSYETLRAIPNPNLTPSPGDSLSRGERAVSRPDAVIQDRSEGEVRPPRRGPGRDSAGENAGRLGTGGPGPRFRDWNPDVRAGARLGVDILYSSRTNEVYSSRLGLRSRDVISRGRPSPAFREASSGIGTDPSSGIGSDAASSGSGQAGSSSTSATSSSSGKKGSSKESGGEKKQD